MPWALTLNLDVQRTRSVCTPAIQLNKLFSFFSKFVLSSTPRVTLVASARQHSSVLAQVETHKLLAPKLQIQNIGMGELNACDKEEDNESKQKIRKYDRLSLLHRSFDSN